MAVLARESHDQLTYLLVDSWPARAPVRIGPAAGDDPPVPAQQRLRRDKECLPRATRHHSAQRRQYQPVALRQLRAPRLPPQDRQLVAQNEQLELLRAVAAREQQDEREQPTGDDVDERHEHRQPPRTGPPTLPRPSQPTSGTAPAPHDRVCAPHAVVEPLDTEAAKAQDLIFARARETTRSNASVRAGSPTG